jgi:hypothetical protein
MYFHNFLRPAPKLEFFHVLGIKLFPTSASNKIALSHAVPLHQKLLQQLLFQSMPNPMDTPFLNAVPNNDELYTRVIELGNHKLRLRTLIFRN